MCLCFQDYGDEWQTAWNEHVANWEAIEGAENYIHRTEWKEDHIRTVAEQAADPYPENLVVTCLESYSQNKDGTYTYLDMLATTQARVYCRALTRSKDKPYTYEVEMDVTINDNPYSIVVYDVPEQAIFLYERAFAADWHLPNAFRHEIMIPDNIFPEKWQNGPWTEDMALKVENQPSAVESEDEDEDGDDEEDDFDF
jgi:hypothetical protein